jgi:hypothetical protein
MKFLVLAVAAAVTPIAACTIGLLLVPVLALSSGGEPRADLHDVPADTPIPYARLETIDRLVQASPA